MARLSSSYLLLCTLLTAAELTQVCSFIVNSNNVLSSCSGQHLQRWITGQRQQQQVQHIMTKMMSTSDLEKQSSTTTPPGHHVPVGQPYPVTWSNPTGSVFEMISDNVWGIERPFMWNTIDVGGRATVVKLNDGSLWVHSPVNLDDELKLALETLGPVKHVVAPNFEHVKYTRQWLDAYPEARGYGCPDLKEKKRDLGLDTCFFDSSTGPTGVPEGWPEQILVKFLNVELNPFTLQPFFNEVVFCDTVSKSLMVTDVYWNYPSDDPLMSVRSKLWKFGMDRVYLPFYRNFMVVSQSLLTKMVDDIVANWPVEILVPCHGSVVYKNAKQVFRDHVLNGKITKNKMQDRSSKDYEWT